MLQRFIKRGVPVQALGVQAHLRTNEGIPTWNGLNKFLLEIEKLNLQVFVTELDVRRSVHARRHLRNAIAKSPRSTAASSKIFSVTIP